MNLVQLSTAADRGAYYYDPTNGSLYHVPRGELLKLDPVGLPQLLGVPVVSLLLVMGIVHFTRGLRYDAISPLLLLAVLPVSACLPLWLVRRWQRRVSRTIREGYRPVAGVEPGRFSRRIYGMLLVYCLFLALFALLAFGEAVGSGSLLAAFFAVVFFDAGAMVLAILQPIGKLRAYTTLKRNAGLK